VLVVDDNVDTLELVELVLSQAGVEVRLARTAEEGLAVLDEFVPDAIVSDLAIPDEDGFSFIGRVRAFPLGSLAAVPALAVSAHAYPEDRARALAAGFQSFLSKPVEPDHLVSELVRILCTVPLAAGAPVELAVHGGAGHGRDDAAGN
jgi:CheY-like chemotaxis protein